MAVELFKNIDFTISLKCIQKSKIIVRAGPVCRRCVVSPGKKAINPSKKQTLPFIFMISMYPEFSGILSVMNGSLSPDLIVHPIKRTT